MTKRKTKTRAPRSRKGKAGDGTPPGTPAPAGNENVPVLEPGKRVAVMQTIDVQPERSNAVPPEAVTVGKVSIREQIPVTFTLTSPTSGVRVNLRHLGIERPDGISDASGNAKYLDDKRPPVIEKDYAVVFFDPQMAPGEYNMMLQFSWDEELEPVTPKPLVDGAYDGYEPVKA